MNEDEKYKACEVRRFVTVLDKIKEDKKCKDCKVRRFIMVLDKIKEAKQMEAEETKTTAGNESDLDRTKY